MILAVNDCPSTECHFWNLHLFLIIVSNTFGYANGQQDTLKKAIDMIFATLTLILVSIAFVTLL
jgi:hypothetical protein